MKLKKRTSDYSTTTAGNNGMMLAAEQARNSVFALVPCTGMARDSGALGSCTGVAKDSGVALGSAAKTSHARVLSVKQVRRLV